MQLSNVAFAAKKPVVPAKETSIGGDSSSVPTSLGGNSAAGQRISGQNQVKVQDRTDNQVEKKKKPKMGIH